MSAVQTGTLTASGTFSATGRRPIYASSKRVDAVSLGKGPCDALSVQRRKALGFAEEEMTLALVSESVN